MPSFDPTQRRILGVLIEKRLSTPGQYPLTTNALVSGCCQKNNRNPILELSGWEVDGALRALLVEEWIREVRRAGGRSKRIEERLSERLGLDDRQSAALGELLLRGPSTMGEIRTRAERMTPMGTLEEVHELLAGLAVAPHQLVEELPRAAGERGQRWRHLLSPAAEEPPAREAAPQVPAEAPHDNCAPPIGRLEALEQQVARLAEQIAAIAAHLDLEIPASAPPPPPPPKE